MDQDASKDECSDVMETSGRVVVEKHQETRDEKKASEHYPSTHDELPKAGILDDDGDSSDDISAGGSKKRNEISLDSKQKQAAGCELYDDVSSIFSDRESDEKEREILQDALLHLKNDDPFGFEETCSEFSEDLSEIESCFSRTETVKNNDSAETNGAHEAQIGAIDQEMMHHKRESFQGTAQQDELHFLRSGGVPNQSSYKNAKGEQIVSEVLAVKDWIGGSDSPDSGYIGDILARENEKLSEIIDHLHMKATSYPREADNCPELVDGYVRKERYDMIEGELSELESKLREKDRRLREQERTAEEERYEHEEGCRLLKHSLAEAERKVEKKTKELENCEAKVKEVTTKQMKQLGAMEGELENTRQENLKLEESILILQKHNANLERELQGMGQHILKLEAREEQLEDNYRRDINKLEEYVEMVNDEKEKMKEKAEELQQELLQTKERVLDEAGRRVVEGQKVEPGLESGNKTFVFHGSQVNGTMRTPRMVEERCHGPVEAVAVATHDVTENKTDIENKIQEEQRKRKQLEDENQMMSKALQGLSAGDYSPLQTLLSGEMFCKIDVKCIQEKLSEKMIALEEAQFKNEEGEAEIKRLKRKSERLEKDVAQMIELEGKNEELHVELERANRRLREVQRTAETAREEVEEMTDIVQKLKEQNSTHKDEAERLRAEIKHTEELLVNAQSQLANAREEEDSKVNAKHENTEKKNLKLELENNSLRQDLENANDKIRALEEKLTTERRELMAEYRKELEHLKEKYVLKQDELNDSAKMVREVTEEWKRMLRETVSRNEELLHKAQEEKRQALDELETKAQEMDRQLSMCKCKLGKRLCDDEEEDDNHHKKGDLQQKKDIGTTKMVDNVHEQTETLQDADMHTQEEYAEKIRTLAKKHEQEIEELKVRLDKESEEARGKIKEELTRSLVMRSATLERRIEGLVLQKVQQEKQRNRRQSVQYRREIEKYSTTIGELKEMLRQCDAERKMLKDEKEDLEVSVNNLKNELRSSKEAEERMIKEVRKMEEGFAMERRLRDMVDERIEKIKETMDEGHCGKMLRENNTHEVGVQQSTAAVILSSHQKENCSSEPDEREVKDKTGHLQEKMDFSREKMDISHALDSLRREIERLKANWQQLHTGNYNQVENDIKNTQPAHPKNADTTEFFLLEDESFQPARREKGVLEERARGLEIEVKWLQDQMREQEARSRREHVSMRRRFQSEKEEMEKEFRREKDGWQAQMGVLASSANLRRVQAVFDGRERIITRRNVEGFLGYQGRIRSIPAHVG